MARLSKRRQTGRRSPLAAAALIGIGLLITGGVYAGASAAMAATTDTSAAETTLTVEDGQKLFQANCATCHGLDLQGTDSGPSLYGAGELSVHFQVSTGRMPLQAQAPQAPQKPVQFTDEQIAALAAFVQSVAPGRRLRRRRAVPHQLRHVPQRGRRRWRAHRGQVRPVPALDLRTQHVRGHGHRPAEHAGLQ